MQSTKKFDEQLSRLKTVLGVDEDQDVARALGLTKAALSARKTRGSFPADKLYALAAMRPDLGIDVSHVLRGITTGAAASEAVKNIPAAVHEVRSAMGEAEFAAAWGIGAEQLAQIESGQRLPSPDLLKRLAALYPDHSAYLLTGMRPELPGPLSGAEVVLVANYRASSEEGQAALRRAAAFHATYPGDALRPNLASEIQ